MATALQKRAVSQLQPFITFTQSTGVPGIVTEIGIPQGKPGSSNAIDAANVVSWQMVLDYWLRVCDANNISVTAWASGFWGDYNLGIYTNATGYTATGTNLSRVMSPGAADVMEAHPPMSNLVWRGTDGAGGEFGSDFGGGNGNGYSNANPGGVNDGTPRAYYPLTAGDAGFLRTRLTGQNAVVRLSVSWERWQPTPGGALDAAYSTLVTNFANACASNGLGVIIDLHNYARYAYDLGAGNRRILRLRVLQGIDTTADSNGEGRIGAEFLRDLWRRVALLLNDNAGVWAYELMNEPHDVGSPDDHISFFSVLNTQTATDRQTAKDNGLTHVTITAYWDRLQPTTSGTIDATALSTLLSDINDAVAKGLRVMLECALQYPPTWVVNAVPRFVNQSGTAWTDTGASGRNVCDWVWSQTGRTYVSDFIRRLLGAVDLTKIDRMKLGGGIMGELQFPPVGSAVPYSFWGFSTAALGTGLATGQTAMPLPATFKPYQAGNTAADNATFVSWYITSLKNFMVWLINEHKAVFGGFLYVQHPSWGLRSNWTVNDAGYQEAMAQGQDWPTLVGAYAPDRQVQCYCTWSDATDVVSPPTNDSDKAPWRKLFEVAASFAAQGNDKSLLIGGENTGGQSNADMNRVFGPTGAIGLGYTFLNWFNHDQLVSGTLATYANYASNIAAVTSGTFTGTTRYDWEAQSPTATQGWAGENGETCARSTTTFFAGTASMQMSKAIPAGTTGFYLLRANDGATKLGGTLTGNVLRFRALLPTGTPGTWSIRPEWQNASYQWQSNTAIDITPGAWRDILLTFPAGITAPNAFAIQLQTNDIAPAAGTTVTVYIDDYQQGSLASAKVIGGQLNWETISASAVTSIRTTGSTKKCLVAGYGWNVFSWPHTTAWVTDTNYWVVTHQYLDPTMQGVYDVNTASYSQTEAAAQSAGFTADADTTPPTLTGLVFDTPTATGTVLRWTTSEAANARVLWRRQTVATWEASTLVFDSNPMTTSHAVPLTNLPSTTTIVAEVRSVDAVGNLGTPQQVTFTTTGGNVTTVSPAGIASAGAFGTQNTLRLAGTLSPQGIASAQALGGAAVTSTAPVPTGPVLNTIRPNATVAGSAQLTITCTGTGFTAATKVTWNGVDLATTYVNSTTLTAVIPSADLIQPGVDMIDVH